MDKYSRILSTEEMRVHYADFYERGQGSRLNRNAVPRKFWSLIPYAEFWGVIDDVERDILVHEAPPDVRRNLIAVEAKFHSALNEWLGGSEAGISPPTPEYVAFAYLTDAADLAAVIIRNEEENYRFLSAAEMAEFYGDFYEKSPRVRLFREAIPFGCQPLTHYAEFWGLRDDKARRALIEQAPPEVLKNLKQVVARFEGDLNDWRDRRDPEYSPSGTEYAAYVAMIKAAQNE